jgi:hypothetical protein
VAGLVVSSVGMLGSVTGFRLPCRHRVSWQALQGQLVVRALLWLTFQLKGCSC